MMMMRVLLFFWSWFYMHIIVRDALIFGFNSSSKKKRREAFDFFFSSKVRVCVLLTISFL